MLLQGKDKSNRGKVKRKSPNLFLKNPSSVGSEHPDYIGRVGGSPDISSRSAPTLASEKSGAFFLKKNKKAFNAIYDFIINSKF